MKRFLLAIVILLCLACCACTFMVPTSALRKTGPDSLVIGGGPEYYTPDVASADKEPESSPEPDEFTTVEPVTEEPAEPTTEPATPSEEATTQEPSTTTEEPTEPVTTREEETTSKPETTVPEPVTEPPHEHNFEYSSTIAPTETTKGYDIYKCSCGETELRNYVNEIPHQHSFQYVSTVAPTETSKGYDVYKCACGESEKRNYVNELPHSHKFTYSKTVAPTEDAKGYDVYVCPCGATEKRNYTDKLPHVHNFKYSKTVEVTSTSRGYDLYTCACGASEKRNYVEIPAWMTDKCSMVDMTYMPYEGEPYYDILAQLLPQLRHNVTMKDAVWVDYGADEEFDIDAYLDVLDRYHQYQRYCCCPYIMRDRHSVFIIFTRYDDFVKAQEFAAQVVQELGINENTTVYDACDKLNAYLCNRLWYDYDNRNSELGIAIDTGAAICHVYSTLFQSCAQKCGIKCEYINDRQMNHAYNRITFSDGTVKYIDVTWNDQGAKKQHKYFMLDRDEFIQLHASLL